MSDDDIIPLAAANEVLATFGIENDNTTYWRWRRDDGFLERDFHDVLNESKLLLGVDWRESLSMGLEVVVRLLDQLGLEANVDVDDDGDHYATEASIEIGGKTVSLEFGGKDDDNFDDVVRPINELIAGRAEFRKLLSSEGSDMWWYGVLSTADWAELDRVAPDLITTFFGKL